MAFSTENRPVIPNEPSTLLRCEICSGEDIVEGSSFDQFLRTPHLKTRDLRCLISSSVGDSIDLVVGLEVVEGLGLEDFGASLDFCLRGFDVGGVASFKTDISESLSTGVVFRFFFGGDLIIEFFSGESNTTTFPGLLTFAFTGDDGGVSLITLFFRLTFFATPSDPLFLKGKHTNNFFVTLAFNGFRL